MTKNQVVKKAIKEQTYSWKIADKITNSTGAKPHHLQSM